MAETARPPVAVLGVDSPIGLTVVRELGERGVPVLAVGRESDSIGRYSRHASGFFQMDAGPLSTWLPALIEARRPAAVLAISEQHLLQLATLKGRLGDCQVLCPDEAMLRQVLDKQRTLTLAASLGIKVPSTWLPAEGEDFEARAAGLAYPVAVKWADPNSIAATLDQQGIEFAKVDYASSPAELLRLLGRYHPIGVWPLVQSWCPGEGFGQMLHMHEGEATLAFQHRRLREWPPTGGVSSFCEAVPPDRHRHQMGLSKRLLKAMDWEGPAMVEYRHNPTTGDFHLMEINGRFWGSLPLAYHCGAHFAWELYRCRVLGETDTGSTAIKMRKARFAVPDARHLAAVLRDADRPVSQRLRAVAKFLTDFLDPRVRYYVWSLRDPRPLFLDARRMVRRLVRSGIGGQDGLSHRPYDRDRLADRPGSVRKGHADAAQGRSHSGPAAHGDTA